MQGVNNFDPGRPEQLALRQVTQWLVFDVVLVGFIVAKSEVAIAS